MKKLLLLCACLLALAAPLRIAAAPPADIVVVRIYGTIIIITRGEGKSEKLELAGGVSDKNLTRDSEHYYKLFEQLYQEGYTVQSTFSTLSNANSGFTTLLFAKNR